MSLTILCVTKSEPRSLPFLESLSRVAKEVGAEFVIAQDKSYEGKTAYLGDIDAIRIPVFTKGFVESVIDEAREHCSGAYILRIDDDEKISAPMVRWLQQERYLANDHWCFPRAWVFPTVGEFLCGVPHWKDHQTRLSVKPKVGGLQGIHCGSPFGSGKEAPVAIEHHVLTERTRDEREDHVSKYDRLNPGSGSNFRSFYIPEDGPFKTDQWADGWAEYSREIVSLIRSIGPHMEQHDAELLELLPWLLSRGALTNVLEIGTNNGGTSALWCELADCVTSIDLPEGPYGNFNQNECVTRNLFLANRYPKIFNGILGDSHSDKTRHYIEILLGGTKLDLLFIDADHTYSGVKQDFEMYREFVKPGGVVLFHDIVETELTGSMQVGVGRFWRELVGEKKEFNVNGDWGGLGALVIP